VPATNWARNVTFGAQAYERPASLDEVRGLVGRSDRIRVLGSGHSFNRIADTTGAQLSLAGLPAEIDIDTASSRVRISAGLTYAQVAPRLQEAGFALPNLASLPHISVAGACATGTHGSGDGNGGLATAIASIEMVTGTGDVVTVERGDDDFDGMPVGLGRLGVVTALTLDLVPSYDIAQYVYDSLPDERLDADFDAIFASGYSVSAFIDFDDHNRLWCKLLAADPPPGPIAFDALAALEPRNPVPGMSPDNCTPQLGIPGPWHERLPHFRAEFAPSSGDERQSEYLLPREHAVAGLNALRGLREQITPVLQIAEIRTIAADELWLSPAYRRPTVGFHFTWVPDDAALAPVIEALERELAPFAPRPHWAKVFSQAAEYERMPDFVRLVGQYDPDGKFGNEFLDGYLSATSRDLPAGS
jgi:xylitol oxidase